MIISCAAAGEDATEKAIRSTRRAVQDIVQDMERIRRENVMG